MNLKQRIKAKCAETMNGTSGYMDYVKTIEDGITKTYNISLISLGRLTPAWYKFCTDSNDITMQESAGCIIVSGSTKAALTQSCADIIKAIDSTEHAVDAVSVSCTAWSKASNAMLTAMDDSSMTNIVQVTSTVPFKYSNTRNVSGMCRLGIYLPPNQDTSVLHLCFEELAIGIRTLKGR